MNYEEAQRFEENLDPDERPVFIRARNARARLKERLKGTTAIITRRMWRAEFGGKMSVLCQYAEAIETLEAGNAASDAELPEGILPSPIKDALEGLRKLLETEWRALGAEEHKRFQELALQEKARSDALLKLAQDKIADLEAAGREAGAESRDFDLTQQKLQAADRERLALLEQVKALSTDKAVLRESLSGATAQIAQFGDRLKAEAVRHEAEITEIMAAHDRKVIAMESQLKAQRDRITELEAGVFRVLNEALANRHPRPD